MTSAAFVMVIVSGLFVTLSFIDFKEMGVGLAVAVQIDTTVHPRTMLLPASMKVLKQVEESVCCQVAGRSQVGTEGHAPPAGERSGESQTLQDDADGLRRRAESPPPAHA